MFLLHGFVLGTSLALVSPVVRGLSELFLVVENVAQVRSSF